MYFLFMILLLGLFLFIKICQPFAWAMTRLRLIYPILTVIAYLFLDFHPDWKITQFVKIQPFPNNDNMIMDYILILVIILSVASLLQELIQMAFPDFTWIGIISSFFSFFIFLPKQIKQKKEYKLQQQNEKKIKELEQKGLIKFVNIRDEVYKVMPDMEKEYYYFRGICSSEDELASFETDWEEYIRIAHNRLETDANDHYTFDEWFGDNQKWRTRTYNKEYLAKERQKRLNTIQ